MNRPLAELAQIPDVQRTLDLPEIQTFVITAYDSISYGDCKTPKFLDAAYLTPATIQAITEEYKYFALHLYRRHSGTGKRFIVANWEADNSVYCGAANRYAEDLDFRRRCDDNYSLLYAGVRSPESSFAGLRLWFNARQQGIALARAAALASGIAGVSIESAIEFNIVRMLRSNNLKSVLFDVVPYVASDYVSYSAWEAINSAELETALDEDLAEIEAIAGDRGVILGEVGFARSLWGEQALPRTATVIQVGLRRGVSFIIFWCLYDQGSRDDFGFVNEEGGLTDVGAFIKQLLTDIPENLKIPRGGARDPRPTPLENRNYDLTERLPNPSI